MPGLHETRLRKCHFTIENVTQYRRNVNLSRVNTAQKDIPEWLTMLAISALFTIVRYVLQASNDSKFSLQFYCLRRRQIKVHLV